MYLVRFQMSASRLLRLCYNLSPYRRYHDNEFFDIISRIYMVDYQPRHRTYFSSLIQVPLHQKEGEEIHV